MAFGGVELTFLAANLSKVAHGGWLPLLIAARGVHRHDHLAAGPGDRRRQPPQAGGLAAASSSTTSTRAGCPGSTGTAVFPHPGKDTTPLALRANVEHNKILHQDVLIVSASSANVPHVPVAERFEIDHLGHEDDRIQHLSVRFGFSDEPNLPEALAPGLRDRRAPSRHDPACEDASFFLSRGAIRRTRAKGMAPWRKVLFLRPGPQRRRPGRLLRPAGRPDRHDGQPGRDLTPA